MVRLRVEYKDVHGTSMVFVHIADTDDTKRVVAEAIEVADEGNLQILRLSATPVSQPPTLREQISGFFTYPRRMGL